MCIVQKDRAKKPHEKEQATRGYDTRYIKWKMEDVKARYENFDYFLLKD